MLLTLIKEVIFSTGVGHKYSIKALKAMLWLGFKGKAHEKSLQKLLNNHI